LLTVKDHNHALCEIVSFVKNVNIHLNSDVGVNSIEETEDKFPCCDNGKTCYVVSIEKDHSEYDKFTFLNHELGHLLFESPTETAHELLESWSKKHKGFESEAFNCFWDCLNYLEDQRIESLCGLLWQKNKVRFEELRRQIGRTWISGKNGVRFISPKGFLYGKRFFVTPPMASYTKMGKDNIVARACVEALDMVEYTGSNGGLYALAMLKPHIDKWFKYLSNRVKRGKRQIQELQDMLDKDALTNPDGWDSDERKTRERLLTKLKEECELFYKRFGYDNLTDGNHTYFCGYVNSHRKQRESYNIGKGIRKKLKEERENGLKDIDNIMDKLNTLKAVKKPDYVKERIVSIKGKVGKPDLKLVNQMRRSFLSIMEMPKESIDYDGDDIDIEAFINNKAGGFDLNNCFKTTKISHGASILLSIDCSDSMKPDVVKVRNLVATLFKSIEGMYNVELKAVLWSSDCYGNLNVSEVDSIKDTNLIISDQMGLTPTHLAVDYCSKVASRMRGRKKIMIIITDGDPYFIHNVSEVMEDKEIIQLTKTAIRNALPRTSIVCFKVGDSSICDSIFRGRIVNVSDMNTASSLVAKKFESLVRQVL